MGKDEPPGEGDEQALWNILGSLQDETQAMSLRVNHSVSASPCRQHTVGGCGLKQENTWLCG
jgi:hypothetical protein